jgi:2-iminobutanoate/2-iminopropanoate deaminase
MSRKIIKTDKASLPVGPYNQAVSIDNLIFTAGQIPLDKQGNMVSGGIKEQTEQVIQNLIAVLTHGGSSLEHVVKATVYLKDLNDFAGMNEVYGKYFKSQTAPARTTIQVARIPKDSLVEIEVVAYIH